MTHIIDFFEHTVSLYPDKKAIAYKDEAYSFAQLKDEAKKLAGLISESGYMHRPIAVIVNRSAQAAVLFMAVLYSGNYYIPIDPEMPEMKIRSILEDADPQILLYEDAQEEVLIKSGFSGRVVKLSDAQAIDLDKVELPVITPDAPAYMVYTSGSTGKPKGVLKSHKAVCSFIESFARQFELTADEIIGNQTPFFFDASAKDLYLMLYTGATMEVIPSELFMFPVKLMDYLNERKVTYACWVPTAYAMVTQLSTFKYVKPETLRKAYFVGEVFPIKQLRKWMETLPEIQYVNLYGSTEISGISCFYELDSSQTDIEVLPMGKALPNCEIFLMDGDKRVKEPGHIGEVCIISDALALEYYHDPEKTAAVFVQMTMPDGRVCRVLKSGDLAHYDNEGNLLFSSRKDFQIKHLGRRIELGEIESVTDALECVVRCCCLYDTIKKKIVLFVQLVPDCGWDSKLIKAELRRHLSEYMIPGKVVILENMPYNANGKIDRTALKGML